MPTFRTTLMVACCLMATCLSSNRRVPKGDDVTAMYYPNTIIFEKLGVLLKQTSLVALDTDSSIINVFYKVKTRTKKACESTESNRMVEIKVKEAVEIHENLMKIHHGRDGPQEGNRKKRFLAAIVGGILGLATSGISSLLINRNVNKFKNEFHEFKDAVHGFEVDQINLDKRIIHIIKEQKDIACEVEQHQILEELKPLLAYFYAGSFEKQRLKPQIFKPKDLVRILKDHEELKETLYKISKLEYLYLAANVHVGNVKFDDKMGELTVHFLLTVPWLTGENTHPLYKTKEVEKKNKEGCWKIGLPPAVMKIGAAYHTIRDQECENRFPLMTCNEQKPAPTNNISCLTQGQSCVMSQETCNRNYIYDLNGLLAFVPRTATAVETRKERRIVKIDGPRFKFFPWAEYALITIDNMTHYRPSYIETNIEVILDQDYTVVGDNWDIPIPPITPITTTHSTTLVAVIGATGVLVVMILIGLSIPAGKRMAAWLKTLKDNHKGKRLTSSVRTEEIQTVQEEERQPTIQLIR